VRRLYPEAAPASIARTLAELELRERAPAERPYVVTNFAVTIDGHATIGGLAGQIGSERDTETLMGLRERADAVLVGAGTIRAERYGRLLPDAERRSRRERKGLSPEPLAVIVSAKLDLPWDIGMFAEGGRVLIVTSADGDPPETPVSVRVDRHHGGVDLAAAMRALRSERGVRLLVSEGGPRLHGALHAAGLVDELFVTIAPKLGGGGGPRMLEGSLPGPVSLELLGLLEAEGELFARYRVES
jgi:riboflavin-specific deaminase-like protein